MPREQMYSDDEILNALRRCIEEAIIPAAEVSERLPGTSSRYVKDRLLEMKDKGLVQAKYHGNVWCFRPIQ